MDKTNDINIAAVVILYNPDNNVINNISSYASFVKTTYVLDNSERRFTEITEEIKKLPNVVYSYAGENRGIARRLNEAYVLSKKENISYLLTMDQDSFFNNNTVPNYFNCIDHYSEKNNTAMFGIQFSDATASSNICRPRKTEKLITSGSVVNISLFDDVSLFDENLFIDEVDNEFCYRSIMRGYQIVQFTNIYLQHTLGTESFHSSIKSLKKTKRRLHHPIRLYYMTRNFFYIQSKYEKHFPASISASKHALLTNIKNNLLYNNARLKILRYFLQGIVDFKKNRMGKYFKTERTLS